MTAPGWYADPDPAATAGSQRFWDGSAWSSTLLRSAQPVGYAPMPAPPAQAGGPSYAPAPAAFPPPQLRRCSEKQVLVWTGALENGHLPDVCLVTGQPGASLKKKKTQYVPSVALFGLIGGPLIYAIVSTAMSRRVTARVPLSAAGRTTLRNRLLAAPAAFAAGVALIALAGGTLALVLVGVGLIVASLFLLVAATSWLPVWVSDDRYVVQLKKVHPDFARAVRQQQGLPG